MQNQNYIHRTYIIRPNNLNKSQDIKGYKKGNTRAYSYIYTNECHYYMENVTKSQGKNKYIKFMYFFAAFSFSKPLPSLQMFFNVIISVRNTFFEDRVV